MHRDEVFQEVTAIIMKTGSGDVGATPHRGGGLDIRIVAFVAWNE